jgi:hypothetical protein
LYYTEPEAMKKLVPVWHRSYQTEAMLRSMHSKEAGTIGLGPIILWRRGHPFSYDRVRLSFRLFRILRKIEPMSNFHAIPGRAKVHSHFFKLNSEV